MPYVLGPLFFFFFFFSLLPPRKRDRLGRSDPFLPFFANGPPGRADPWSTWPRSFFFFFFSFLPAG